MQFISLKIKPKILIQGLRVLLQIPYRGLKLYPQKKAH